MLESGPSGELSRFYCSHYVQQLLDQQVLRDRYWYHLVPTGGGTIPGTRVPGTLCCTNHPSCHIIFFYMLYRIFNQCTVLLVLQYRTGLLFTTNLEEHSTTTSCTIYLALSLHTTDTNSKQEVQGRRFFTHHNSVPGTRVPGSSEASRIQSRFAFHSFH